MRQKRFVVKIIAILTMSFIFGIEIFASAENIRTVSNVANIGVATITTNLEMFSTIGTVSTTSTSGTLRDITLVKISHRSNSPGDGVYRMNTMYKLQDSLKGKYRISNVKTRVTNSSKANVNIKNQGADEVYIILEEYLADDINKDAVVEIIGDITYSSSVTESGTGTISATNIVGLVQQNPLVQTLTLPMAVNEYIKLSIKPLDMGEIIPNTNTRIEKTDIDITGGKNTEVLISVNGVSGAETKGDYITSGTEKIPIRYRIENENGTAIKSMTLDTNGVGRARLRGRIETDDIKYGQKPGSYSATVTIDVDYL